LRTRPEEVAGRAYCSSANLGAGFDSLGLALEKYSDIVRIRATQRRGIRIIVKGPQAHNLPRDISKNSAGPPAKALLRMARMKHGLAIIIDKNVPPGLGLGSSGATAAACTKTLDHFLDLNISNDELARVASLGEKAVAGTPHADNVAASLLGGFAVVYGSPLRTISIKPPSSLTAVVATPRFAIQNNKTRKARGLVPKIIETKKAVSNIGRAAAIVGGFALGNIQMIGTGMEDEIAEPHRRDLIPGYHDVRRLALEAGAAGVSISGAGPSLISIVDRRRYDPRIIARAMVKGFALNKIRSTWFVARPAPGARIIEG
jgi:homoserine kinase